MGKLIKDIGEIVRLPRISVNLMLRETAGNDPFFAKITEQFYASSRKRHRKLPLIGLLTHGVAICELPADVDAYFMMIDAAGRRNVKKANRNGYQFERIVFNSHLDDIGDIRRSATSRQGELPDAFLKKDVAPCDNPDSSSPLHDYPYFGVLKDGHLVAYMGVLIAGELAIIEHIYGHAEFQRDGVVPKMIVDTAGYLMKHHSGVKYYAYGSYYGASESLRRFKRKFKFLPYRVKWILGK
jgi:hypothetical protein